MFFSLLFGLSAAFRPNPALRPHVVPSLLPLKWMGGLPLLTSPANCWIWSESLESIIMKLYFFVVLLPCWRDLAAISVITKLGSHKSSSEKTSIFYSFFYFIVLFCFSAVCFHTVEIKLQHIKSYCKLDKFCYYEFTSSI